MAARSARAIAATEFGGSSAVSETSELTDVAVAAAVDVGTISDCG